ncbi:MAG: hypothetical protein ACI4M6_04430 [Christensenellaceae bacterium]
MIFQQIVVILLMFAACLIFSFVINKFFNSRNDEDKNHTKIYYITNIDKKRKKNKTPKVALKDAVIQPEEFQKYLIDNEKDKKG